MHDSMTFLAPALRVLLAVSRASGVNKFREEVGCCISTKKGMKKRSQRGNSIVLLLDFDKEILTSSSVKARAITWVLRVKHANKIFFQHSVGINQLLSSGMFARSESMSS